MSQTTIHACLFEPRNVQAIVIPYSPPQDRNYPGSYYTLTYDPGSDSLAGVYHHLGLAQNFDVAFTRLAPEGRQESGELSGLKAVDIELGSSSELRDDRGRSHERSLRGRSGSLSGLGFATRMQVTSRRLRRASSDAKPEGGRPPERRDRAPGLLL
jgi:hypothetical protein